MFSCSVNAAIISLRRFIPLCTSYVCRLGYAVLFVHVKLQLVPWNHLENIQCDQVIDLLFLNAVEVELSTLCVWQTNTSLR